MKPSLKIALSALLYAALVCPVVLQPVHADNTVPAQALADASVSDDNPFGSPETDVKEATAAIKAGGDRDTLVAAYNKRADALRELHRFQEADDDYGKVLELCKQAPATKNYVGVASYFRGQTELELGDGDGAAADFTAAIADQNDWSDAFLGRARAHFLQGDLTGALADAKQAKAFLKTEKDKAAWKDPAFDEDLAGANKAVHDKPTDAEARRARGVLHFRAARTDPENGPAEMQQALNDFRGAGTLDPKAPAPWLDLALAQMALNNGRTDLLAPFHRDEVLANLDKATALDPKYPPALAAHAIYLVSTPISAGILPDAEAIEAMAKANAQAVPDGLALLERAATLQPSAGEWPMLMAVLESTRPQPDAAKLITYYSRAIALEPQGLPAEIGWLWPGAVSASMTAHTGAPDGKDVFKAEALAARGHVYAATNDWDHALADLDASLKLQDQKAGHLLRARVYAQKKNWDGVIADANAALGDDGQAGDDLPDLSELVKPALSDSDRADALLLRASARDQKGDFAKAQTDVDAAVKIDPKRAALLKGTRYDKTQPAAK